MLFDLAVLYGKNIIEYEICLYSSIISSNSFSENDKSIEDWRSVKVFFLDAMSFKDSAPTLMLLKSEPVQLYKFLTISLNL